MTITEVNNAINNLMENKRNLTCDSIIVKEEITVCEGFGMFEGTGEYHYVDRMVENAEKVKAFNDCLDNLYKVRDNITIEKYGMTWAEKEEIKKQKAKAKRYEKEIAELEKELNYKKEWLRKYREMAD